MSALGQKQTLEPGSLMSALPPKADIKELPRLCLIDPQGGSILRWTRQARRRRWRG